MKTTVWPTTGEPEVLGAASGGTTSTFFQQVIDQLAVVRLIEEILHSLRQNFADATRSPPQLLNRAFRLSIASIKASIL